MIPLIFYKIKNPRTAIHIVLSTHTYFDHGQEKIDKRGQEILAEWGKMNGMSFSNPKYLQKYREEIAEAFLLRYGRPKNTTSNRKNAKWIPFIATDKPKPLYCDTPECERKVIEGGGSKCEVHA